MAIEKHLLGRIIHKHDIEENWDKATGFIPQQGEIIVYDIDDNYEYERFKIGDGVTTVTNLPFQKTNINDLKAVSYDIAQELTDEQKIQARTNIGAGTPDSIKIIEATYYANGESTISSTEEEINALIAEGKNVCIDCFIEPEDRTFRFYFSTKTSSGTTLFVNTEVSDGAPELKLLTLIGSTFMIITMPVPLRSLATESKDGLMSTEDKVKLNSIEEGAQVNVQSDWNQLDETQSDAILNKPFGEYETVTELLAETEVTGIESDGAAYQYVFDANPFTGDEEKISVTFDGVEYVCNKIVNTDDIFGFGNVSFFDTSDDDTGEPFFVIANMSQNACVMILHDLNPHTISISEVNVNIKAIDPKYLPEGYPYEEVTAIKYDAFGEHNIPLALGQVWEVSYNTYSNRKYDTHEVQVSDDGTLYLGDLTLKNETPYYITATGYDYNSGWYRVMNITNVVVTCVSGTVTETIIHPMDEKFLPSSATAQSDWSVNDENDPAYVKNRTHWEEVRSISMKETSTDINWGVHFGNDKLAELLRKYKETSLIYLGTSDPIPYVYLDGTYTEGSDYCEYKVQWKSVDSGGAQLTIRIDNDGSIIVGYGVTHNNFNSATIEIIGEETIVHTIDPKYIKDMYYEESVLKDVEYPISGTDGGTHDAIPFVLGDKYYFVYCTYTSANTDEHLYGDPTLYEVLSDDTGLYIGDPALNTIPFCIRETSTSYNANFFTNVKPYNMKIKGQVEEEIVHTIDPKYIKDMYYEEIKDVTLVDGLTFEEYNNGTYPLCNFVIGDKYTVIWNDEVYSNLICYYEGGFNVIASEALGCPFYIDDDGGNELFIESNSDDTTFTTVSIIHHDENIVHTINHKYIKDMYYDNGSTTTVLVDNQTITGFEVREGSLYGVQNPFSFAPTVGATYTVTWDGTDYECTAATMSGMAYIGNVNYVNMQSGGDIPFAIVFAGAIFLVTESTEESHTISITEVVHDMKQLDEKYLPILEEKNKEIFSIHNISTGEYETDIVLSEGTYNVIVDDTVMKADFINDGGDIVNQNDLCFISSFDGGIFFGFSDDEPHSVKIEKVHNVVKEEYLPESVTATPNWNAAEGENGYIENRTHYEDRVLVSTFDSSTDKMTPARYYESIDYLVVFDGVEYITRIQHKHHSAIGLYHSYLGSDAGDIGSVDADPPFSLYTHSSSGYPDLDAEEVELYFHYAGFEDGHTCEVYQYDLKKLDPKFLPDGYPYKENDIVYLERTVSEQYQDIDASWLELGKTYIVQYGDTSYELTAETGKSINLWGSSYIYIGCDMSSHGAYGDYPFSIYRIDGSTPDSGGQRFVFKESSVTPTYIKVSNPDIIIHTIDEKFLPVTEDDEILEMLMEQDMLLAVTDSDGSILSDENDNILLW